MVFCPKYRRQVLVNGVDRRLKQIIAEVAEATDSILLETEVMPDHVHLLIDVDPQFGIHRVVKAIKGRPSRHNLDGFDQVADYPAMDHQHPSGTWVRLHSSVGPSSCPDGLLAPLRLQAVETRGDEQSVLTGAPVLMGVAHEPISRDLGH